MHILICFPFFKFWMRVIESINMMQKTLTYDTYETTNIKRDNLSVKWLIHQFKFHSFQDPNSGKLKCHKKSHLATWIFHGGSFSGFVIRRPETFLISNFQNFHSIGHDDGWYNTQVSLDLNNVVSLLVLISIISSTGLYCILMIILQLSTELYLYFIY